MLPEKVKNQGEVSNSGVKHQVDEGDYRTEVLAIEVGQKSQASASFGLWRPSGPPIRPRDSVNWLSRVAIGSGLPLRTARVDLLSEADSIGIRMMEQGGRVISNRTSLDISFGDVDRLVEHIASRKGTHFDWRAHLSPAHGDEHADSHPPDRRNELQSARRTQAGENDIAYFAAQEPIEAGSNVYGEGLEFSIQAARKIDELKSLRTIIEDSVSLGDLDLKREIDSIRSQISDILITSDS